MSALRAQRAMRSFAFFLFFVIGMAWKYTDQDGISPDLDSSLDSTTPLVKDKEPTESAVDIGLPISTDDDNIPEEITSTADDEVRSTS